MFSSFFVNFRYAGQYFAHFAANLFIAQASDASFMGVVQIAVLYVCKSSRFDLVAHFAVCFYVFYLMKSIYSGFHPYQATGKIVKWRIHRLVILDFIFASIVSKSYI